MAAHRKRHSPTRLNWLIILVFSTIVFGAFYFLSGLGPRTSAGGADDRMPNAEIFELRQQSVLLEEEFDENVLGGVVDREDIEILLRAIEVQKQFIAELPGRDFNAEGRLENLERKLNDYMGEIRVREAERLEAEAEALMETDRDAALNRLREALEIREDIRERYWSSTYNSTAALSRLRRTVDNLAMTPQYERSVALEQEAQEHEKRGEFDSAERKYGEAAEIQEVINRGYPGLPVARPLRATRLREKEAEVVTSQIKRQVDDLLSEGNDLLYNDKHEEAAAFFARARELQRNLNLEYPRSPNASRAREEFLRVRQQNAAGFPSYQDLLTSEGMLNKALFEGNFIEAELLVNRLSDEISQFRIRYSQSTLPIERLAERISYLKRKESAIPAIFATITRNLLDLPGDFDARMLATEVPQFLFEEVMDTNPSRRKGPDLPVETVSGAEVRVFLERVSWILARQVRLPSREEFKEAAEAALETVDLEILAFESGEESALSVTTGDPDQMGYYHLTGNVSEMVTDIIDGDNLLQMGGNLRMLEAEVRVLNAIPVNLNERNRMIGFRFVVEDRMLSLSLPTDPDF